MFSKPLPRFVIPKTPCGVTPVFYHNLYRKRGCTISNEPLGIDYATACSENGDGGRAAALNALLGEWNPKRKGGQITASRIAVYGTVDWPFSRAIVGTINPS